MFENNIRKIIITPKQPIKGYRLSTIEEKPKNDKSKVTPLVVNALTKGFLINFDK